MLRPVQRQAMNVILAVLMAVGCLFPGRVVAGPAASRDVKLRSVFFKEAGIALGGVTEGSRLYISVFTVEASGGKAEVQIFDIANPEHPRLLGRDPSAAAATDFVVEKNIAYMARGLMNADEGWLTITDYADPRSPKKLGEVTLPHGCVSVRKYQNYVYVGCYQAGVFVVDVSNPRAPKQIRHITFPRVGEPKLINTILCLDARKYPEKHSLPCIKGRVWYMHINGRKLYVADESTGMHIFDLRDPANPEHLSQFIFPPRDDTPDLTTDAVNHVWTQDNRTAYLAIDSGGFASVDISDPRHPELLDYIDPWADYDWATSPGHFVMMTGRGDRVFGTAGEAGVWVIDAHDPRNLRVVQTQPLPERVGSSYMISLHGDYLIATYALMKGLGRQISGKPRGGWEIFRIVDGNGDDNGGASSAAAMEYDTNRPWGEYSNAPLDKADPALCQSACNRDRRCLAWTYVKPGALLNKSPQCLLKDRVPDPEPATCCVSGVK